MRKVSSHWVEPSLHCHQMGKQTSLMDMQPEHFGYIIFDSQLWSTHPHYTWLSKLRRCYTFEHFWLIKSFLCWTSSAKLTFHIFCSQFSTCSTTSISRRGDKWHMCSRKQFVGTSSWILHWEMQRVWRRKISARKQSLRPPFTCRKIAVSSSNLFLVGSKAGHFFIFPLFSSIY